MTTVSQLGLQQALLSGFQRAQQSSEATTLQLASGNRADNFSGLSIDGGIGAIALVEADGIVTRLTAFENNINLAGARFERQAINFDIISSTLIDLRNDVVNALSSGEREALGERLQRAADAIVSALNDSVNGQFIFGGVDNRERLVTLSPGSFEAILQDGNNIRETLVQLDEDLLVSGGPLAGQFGQTIFNTLESLRSALENGETSIESLQNSLVSLDQDISQITQLQEEVGIRQNQVSAARLQNRLTSDLAQLSAADIEDVDVAEALSRLSQDQVAIQAAAQALSIATQTSILNFI